MRIELCGQLAVVVEGQGRHQDLPGRQGRLLLAFLALHRARPVSRGELIDVLWGDGPPGNPGQALNVLLSKLRRALGPGVIGGRGGVNLQLADDVAVDVGEAEQALDAARSALDRGEADVALALAREAAETADRGLLPGYEGDWLEEPRRCVAELRLQARECLTEAGLRLGGVELARAERTARTLIELDPYRESGHVLLMRVLEAQGNVAEALRVFGALRERLDEELGLLPSPGVQRLFERLLKQEGTSPAPPPAPPAPPVAAAADAPPAPAAAEPEVAEPAVLPLPYFATRSHGSFVGRVRELEHLGTYLDRARRRHRQVVLLEGEPGIGKTRLAEQFAAACHEAGVAVLYGRCDAEALVPYQPFVEALRLATAGVDGEQLRRRIGVHVDELARVLPELGDATGEVRPRGDPDAARFRLFEAVASVLTDLASTRPVLLILDDLHWADKPTLLMLRQIVRVAEASPLLLLGTYRDTERGDALLDALADLRREHFFERITLTGLREPEAAALISSLSDARVPPRFNRALCEETKGNPFFLEEMVRHLASTSGGAAWTVGAVPLPEGVKEVIGRRLARLAEDVRRVLTVAAVVGRTFPLDVLEQVTGHDEDRLDELLGEAVRAHVVTEDPEVFGRYSFSHSLIRQTLTERMTATQRARLHLRVGQALEALAPDAPGPHLAELAHHFAQAPPGPWRARAADFAERAARHAIGMLAYEEAVRLRRLALAALGTEGVDPERHLGLLLALGDAEVRAGDAAAKRTFEEALALAQAQRRPAAQARAALGLGATGHMKGGVVDEGLVAALEAAMAALGGADDVLRARLLARLAIELCFSDQRERRAALAEEAVAVARRAGHPGALGYALTARHWALWGPENLDDRLGVAADLLRLAEQTGERGIAVQAHRWRLIDLLELGDIDAVDAEIAAYSALVQERRQPSRWYAELFRAMRLLLRGRFAEAEAASAAALALGQRVEDPNAHQAVTLQHIVLRREQGRLAELEDVVRANVERYPALPGWRCLLAHVLAELGRDEEARSELDVLGADRFGRLPDDGLWLGAVAYLAETAARLGEAEHGAVLHELLLPYAERNVPIGWAAACVGSASRPLALAAALLGEHDRAVEHFEAALAGNARMGARPWVARTQVEYAGLLLAVDPTSERGAHLLAEGRAGARELGMVALLDTARGLRPVAAGGAGR